MSGLGHPYLSVNAATNNKRIFINNVSFMKYIQLLCFLFSATAAVGGGFGGRQIRAGHDVYESTVTTEMGYHEEKSSKKSKQNKKGGHHAEYEYVPGDMSMDSGKGKGGKGKGKGSKLSKKGKKGGAYPTEAPHPTPTYVPTGSQDYPTTRPPTPISEPTLAPAVSPVGSSDSLTSSPTDEDSVSFLTTPFALVYVLENSRQASRAELDQVVDVTRLYMEEFMIDQFKGSSFTVLDDFITKMITNQYMMGEEYIIDYSGEGRFNPFSSVFPGTEQLDEAVQVAFAGENLSIYTSRLTGLPSSNVFRNAQVTFGATVVQVARKSNAATIAAAAVAATLLAAGFALFKHRSDNQEYDEDHVKKPSDGTVAGETFAGETHDGTISVDGNSFDYGTRYKDEEEALHSHPTLGTITEDEDDDSVRPSWGASGQRSFDDFETPSDEFVVANQEVEPTKADAIPSPMVLGAAEEESSTVGADEEESSVVGANSFDDMALQGLSSHISTGSVSSYFTQEDLVAAGRNGESKEAVGQHQEVASLLSLDSFEETVLSASPSENNSNPRRPRTISEIEAILSSELEEDEDSEQLSSRVSGASSSATGSSRKKPRTVEEIESLLASGLDDDEEPEVELD